MTTSQERDFNFLVVLDYTSSTAQLLAGICDTQFRSGDVLHPVLRCIDLDTTGHPYLRATVLRKEDRSHRVLLVPHHTVLAIFELGTQEDPQAIGFRVE
jgi:hypothetical protein